MPRFQIEAIQNATPNTRNMNYLEHCKQCKQSLSRLLRIRNIQVIGFGIKIANVHLSSRKPNWSPHE